jgi:hypothetical protein
MSKYRILVGNTEEMRPLEDLYLGKVIIIKLILNK